MVSLHVLKLLEVNGFGTIDQDLFFEKLTLDKTGLYITSRGAPLAKGSRTAQAFDIYARGTNDVDGMKKLEDVMEFFIANQACELPAVPPISSTLYKNVYIYPQGNIENVGLDANNRIIYVLPCTIRYKKEN